MLTSFSQQVAVDNCGAAFNAFTFYRDETVKIAFTVIEVSANVR